MVNQITKMKKRSLIRWASKSTLMIMYPKCMIGQNTNLFNSNSLDPLILSIIKFFPKKKNPLSSISPHKMTPFQDLPWNSISVRNKSDQWIVLAELSIQGWYIICYSENKASWKCWSFEIGRFPLTEKR